MRVGIVARRGSDRAVALAGEIASALAGPSVTVVVDETTHAAMTQDGGRGESTDVADPARTDDADTAASVPTGAPVAALSDCELAVSIGGDGTFLFTARNAGTTPLLGINLGEVGFLTAVQPADAVETVRQVVAEIQERGSTGTMTVPRLVAEGDDWTLEPAVNEVVLSGPRRGHGGGLDVTVAVDGATYTAGHADGVLIATPVGSTAYNLSEGGPLIQPGVDGLAVTVMAGADTMPPLVVRNGSTVRLTAGNASEAVAVADGRVRRSLEPPASLEVSLSGEPLSIAEPSLEYFEALEKLD